MYANGALRITRPTSMHSHFSHDHDHDLCSDHCGENPTVWDLPQVPLGLKREWLRLETRRHFLGKGARALGLAGLATILGRSAPEMLANTAGTGAAGPSLL